jgi:hypothetical protein
MIVCPKLWAEYCMKNWELMYSVGSHGSSSLLLMMKVLVWHIVSDTHKAMAALCCFGVSFAGTDRMVTYKVWSWSFLCNLIDISWPKLSRVCWLCICGTFSIWWYTYFTPLRFPVSGTQTLHGSFCLAVLLYLGAWTATMVWT